MSKVEKYGFVYIWYDNAKSKKHEDEYIKRFYIGCHWGTEDDGYICSSNWMRHAYRRRPQDFKRRIISRIYTNRIELSKEEYKWLSLIKEEELGKKYYNFCGFFIKGKPSLRKGKNSSEKSKQKQSKTMKELYSNSIMVPWNKGKSWSEEIKEKMSKARKGRFAGENCPSYGKTKIRRTKRKIKTS